MRIEFLGPKAPSASSASSASSARPRTRPVAFSLLELILAFTILGLAIVPILSLFFGTNRLHNKLSGVFREAIAGQLIWEVLKGRVAINPQYIRDMATLPNFVSTEINHPDAPSLKVTALVHMGAYVADHGPLDEQGRPIPLSTFAPIGRARLNPTPCTIFGSTSGNLEVNPATITPEEFKSLQHNYEDLAFRLQINDGLLPISAGGPLQVSERIKEISIDVYRAGTDGRISATPAYHLDTVLETPAQSLGLSDLKGLLQARDGYSYVSDLDDARRVILKATGDQGMTQAALDAAANVLLLLIESAGEAMMVEGTDLGVGLASFNDGKGVDYYVSQLLADATPVHALLAADMTWGRAQCILRAYRRAAAPIAALPAYCTVLENNLIPLINSLVDDMSVAKTGPSTAASAATTAANDLVKNKQKALNEAAFWYQILANDQWSKAVERPLTYPDRLQDTISKGFQLYRTVESSANLSPMEKIRALNSYVEMVKAEKLYQDRANVPEESLIIERANDYQPCMPDYSDALRHSEALDYNTLVSRYGDFRSISADLRALSNPNHPYRVVVRVLGRQGVLREALPRFRNALNYFGFTDILTKLDRSMGTIVPRTPSGAPVPAPSPPGK